MAGRLPYDPNQGLSNNGVSQTQHGAFQFVSFSQKKEKKINK